MPRHWHSMGACFNNDDCSRPIASGVQVCAVPPLFGAPTRNSQNIKYKHADRRAKNRATPYRVHLLPPFELPRLETAQYARCFVQCYRAYCVIKVLIVWS